MKSEAAWNQIFIFKFDLNVKMVYRKSSLQKKQIFSVGFVKIKELHDVHTWRHM